METQSILYNYAALLNWENKRSKMQLENLENQVETPLL